MNRVDENLFLSRRLSRFAVRQHLPDIAFLGREAGIAVLVQGHLQLGIRAVLLGFDQLVDDAPQLGLGRVDEPVHAVARVEEQGYLDHLAGRVGGTSARRGQIRNREKEMSVLLRSGLAAYRKERGGK